MTTDKHVLVNFSSLVAEVVLHSGVAVYGKKNHNQFAIVFFFVKLLICNLCPS